MIHNDKSKHLKGQLDPPVSNGHIFCTKGGQLDPPVSNGHLFWTKGGQLDRGVSDVTFFGPKDVSFLVGFHGFSR